MQTEACGRRVTGTVGWLLLTDCRGNLYFDVECYLQVLRRITARVRTAVPAISIDLFNDSRAHVNEELI